MSRTAYIASPLFDKVFNVDGVQIRAAKATIEDSVTKETEYGILYYSEAIGASSLGIYGQGGKERREREFQALDDETAPRIKSMLVSVANS